MGKLKWVTKSVSCQDAVEHWRIGFNNKPGIYQYDVQVVVAGVVVTKALFWTDIVIVFGLLVTDFGPGCYDHLNHNHLSAVHYIVIIVTI